MERLHREAFTLRRALHPDSRSLSESRASRARQRLLFLIPPASPPVRRGDAKSSGGVLLVDSSGCHTGPGAVQTRHELRFFYVDRTEPHRRRSHRLGGGHASGHALPHAGGSRLGQWLQSTGRRPCIYNRLPSRWPYPDITAQVTGTGTPSPGIELLSMEPLVSGQTPLAAVAYRSGRECDLVLRSGSD